MAETGHARNIERFATMISFVRVMALTILWVGSEKILSAIWPEGFGAPQVAFQEAVENGPDASGFTADTTLLLMQIVLGSIVSVMSGFLAALIAGENTRAPLVLGSSPVAD